MKRAAAIGLMLLIAPAIGLAQDGRTHSSSASEESAELPTPVETAEYLAYTGFDDMEEFLARLADEAPELMVDTLVSLPGEEPPGRSREPELILVGLRRGDDTVSRRPAVLIIGSQHGDEQSGKEATLQLIRDLAVGPLGYILDAVDVYAVPMMNPWGTATGQRENARGLDLNRDHTRLASPAVASLHAAFVRIRPAVVIDMHELGLTAYDAEIGLPTHPDADSSLIKFGRYRILPYVANELAKAGFSFHEYVTSAPDADVGGDAAETYYTYGPLLASYARNAFALRGAISMLFEVSSSREIHDLNRRVDVHTVALRAALEVIADAADEIVAETSRVRTAELARADSVAAGFPPVIPLQATYASDPRQPVLVWLVLEPEGINTGSTDWKPAIHVSETIARPAGYLIPAGEAELIAALARHGFELWELEETRRLRVGQYPVRDTAASVAAERTGIDEPDDETAPVHRPPARADVSVIWRDEDIPAGTVYVDLSQPAGPLAATILEPWSQDSWYAGTEGELEQGVYPIMRLDRPLNAETRPMPATRVDGILGGP